jgi:signal transduction histidine kinase/ligand-binding sensor domain-containing protein
MGCGIPRPGRKSGELYPARISLPPLLVLVVTRWLRRLAAHRQLTWLAAVLMWNYAGTAVAAQYRLKAWTVENGLPQNVIRGIAQTPDGYLWIATLDGVARFDGMRFTVFNKSNTPGIASNRFGSMVGDKNGDLWLVNEGGDLTRYHRGSFHTYGPEDGVPANSIRGIARDDAGSLWLLSEETVMKWNKDALSDVTPDSLRMHYEPLYWDNAGFWGQDKSGLHIFFEGRFVSYPLPDWLAGGAIWNVGIDGSGRVWLESFDGRQGVIASGKQAVEPVDSDHSHTVSYHDPHGHLWTFHVGPRLTRFLDFESSWEPASIAFTRFLEDREGNVWIGTEGNGLYQLQEQSIDVYSKAQGLIDQDIYPVYQDHSGAIWMGAWSSGLSRFSDGKFTNFTTAQGLPGRLVSALGGDRDGNLWVATHGGLGVFRDGQFHKPEVMLPEHAVAQAILQDKGGTMWIGTTNGLVTYREGPSRTLTVQDGLAGNDVKVIVESASGDLWIGGYGGLTRLHDGQFTHWSERDGLPSDNIRAIYEDSDGVIWIGTYDGGLGRYKDGKFTRYTERDGLFNNGVFQILEDARNNFWMSSNRGIFRVSKQELNALADGKRAKITSVAYGKADGMLNVECNGGMWPAGIKAIDGRLWFPTQDGVAVIDPESVRINPQPPPVVIEAAYVDRAPADIQSALKIPSGKENLEIEYTALSFIRSEQIRFRYKLEGLDSDWIDAGSRRTAYYSHLPPGTYEFHVIADNSDGVWNNEGQKLAITVQAPFYRTWWFIALEALVVAALITLAVRYRLAQLERAQAMQRAFSQQLIASQENERQRIASELHDSLGQRLVVINNLALFAMRAQGKGAAAGDEPGAMEEISAEAALAMQETREISYNLRPFQLDRLGLTKAVEGMARTVSSASGIRITSKLDNIDDVFPADLRINFYRIVQESLNNIMKHSGATEAEVRVTRNGKRIILSIRDNGLGFNPAARPSKGGKSGFGLTGMEERAHLLGGDFRVRSTPGQGTVMTAEFPIQDESHG